MYALSGHTILDTLEGYRSSGIHKERSKFFMEDFPSAGIYIFILLLPLFHFSLGTNKDTAVRQPLV